MFAGLSRTWIPFAYLIAGSAWVIGCNHGAGSNAEAWSPSGAWPGFLFVMVSALVIFVVQRAPAQPPGGAPIAAATQQAQAELQRAHDQLENRVRERTQELELVKDFAERSDRVKTAFLTTISHELRTPLNSIVGFTELMLEGYSGPLTEAQQRQLSIVRESSSHLRALIENVLDITRIEAGEVGFEFTSIDMEALVSRHVGAFEAAARRKGLSLQLRMQGSIPLVCSDARRVGQILTNLLGNAIKFTDHGEVTVEMASLDNRFEVSVADTGIGIAAAMIPALFKPFSQAPRPGGRLYEGPGLGLAISRTLARALGGDVAVASVEGGGSRFTLSLPLQSPMAG